MSAEEAQLQKMKFSTHYGSWHHMWWSLTGGTRWCPSVRASCNKNVVNNWSCMAIKQEKNVPCMFGA